MFCLALIALMSHSDANTQGENGFWGKSKALFKYFTVGLLLLLRLDWQRQRRICCVKMLRWQKQTENITEEGAAYPILLHLWMPPLICWYPQAFPSSFFIFHFFFPFPFLPSFLLFFSLFPLVSFLVLFHLSFSEHDLELSIKMSDTLIFDTPLNSFLVFRYKFSFSGKLA